MSNIVLLVDDNELTRAAEAFRLRQSGHYVLTAGSLHQASAYLRAAQVDLVVLDLGLPDGDGLSLADQLRRDRVPFIICSAREEDESIVRSVAAGAQDYLVKPVGLDELAARVNVALVA